MNQQQTQETLDALADLFLTGAMGPAEPPPAPVPVATANARRPALGRGGNQALDGPPPLRLAPKLHPNGVAAIGVTAARTPRPVADRPVARITEDGNEAAAQARPVRVEAVFLGNLPGFGGPWLTQYAHHLARQSGDVLLLHADEDGIEAELVSAERAVHDPFDARYIPWSQIQPSPLRLADDGGAEPPLVELIRRLTGRGPMRVSAILVHLPEPSTAGVIERALDLPRWTLLCGGFDAAVVAGYRLIKQLVEAGLAAGRTPPPIGLMVMGDDEDRSQAASRKLNAAAAGFLKTPVELVGWQKRMVPVNLRLLGSFAERRDEQEPLAADAAAGDLAPGRQGLWPEVAAALRDLRPADGAPGAASTPPPAGNLREVAACLARDLAAEDARDDDLPPEAEAPGDDDPGLADRPATSTGGTAPAGAALADAMAGQWLDQPGPQEIQQLVGDFVEPDAEAPSVSPPSSPARPRQRIRDAAARRAGDAVAPPPMHTPPPRRPHASTAATGRDLDLVQFLRDPRAGGQACDGFLPIQARCPRHPRTQIALDQRGRLHLLCRPGNPGEPEHDSEGRDARAQRPAGGAAPVDQAAALRAAVVDLIETRAWVKEHLDLLQLTQRQCRFDLAASPVLHLFTGDARLAAQIAGRLGRFVKLHLLHQVHLGPQSTWFCAPIN